MEKTHLKWLIERLHPHRVSLFVILFSFPVMMGYSFFYPILVRNITDRGMVQRDLSQIVLYALLLFGLLAGEQLTSLWQTKLFIGLQSRFQLELFCEIQQKLLKLKLSYYDRRNSGGVVEQLNTDVETVSLLIDSGMKNLFNYMLRMVSGVGGLLLIEPVLTGLLLLYIPLKYLLVTLTSVRKKKLMEAYIADKQSLFSWLSDILGGIREIKLWELYGTCGKGFYERQKRVTAENRRNIMLDSCNAAGDMILNGMLTASIYGIGGWLILRERLSIGSLIAFLTYSGYVTGPISLILDVKYLFAKIGPSAGRLYDFFRLEEETSGALAIEADDFKSLILRDVSFAYQGTEVLQHFDLEIYRGEKIAMIGENGSGKTTLIKILLRLEEDWEGTIRMNGTDIRMYELNAYRRLFGVVNQDVYLFRLPVRQNIDLWGTHTREAVEEACKTANIEGILEEDAAETAERGGSTLSGGEKQKIAVARMLLKDAPIVILDEATSQIDRKTNEKWMKELLEEFAGKTVLWITHNHAQLEVFDRICEIRRCRD